MGTRNLIAVYKDGEYKVAQYGQWDGYPSGQGISVLAFLKEYNLDIFKNKLSHCFWLSDQEIKTRYEDMFIFSDEHGMISCDEADRFDKRYPELSRDTGANILRIIYGIQEQIGLRNSISFVSDSLFCEWAYVIDFDKNTFEVYEGFNQKPLESTERFYNYFDKDQKNLHGEIYYPCNLLALFDLNDLPSKEDFLNVCEPKEKAE